MTYNSFLVFFWLIVFSSVGQTSDKGCSPLMPKNYREFAVKERFFGSSGEGTQWSGSFGNISRELKITRENSRESWELIQLDRSTHRITKSRGHRIEVSKDCDNSLQVKLFEVLRLLDPEEGSQNKEFSIMHNKSIKDSWALVSKDVIGSGVGREVDDANKRWYEGDFVAEKFFCKVSLGLNFSGKILITLSGPSEVVTHDGEIQVRENDSIYVWGHNRSGVDFSEKADEVEVVAASFSQTSASAVTTSKHQHVRFIRSRSAGHSFDIEASAEDGKTSVRLVNGEYVEDHYKKKTIKCQGLSYWQ